jgi:uncharacterized membrane protein
MGRILSLSDGIFAFAMTLLVLELAVPTTPLGTHQLSHYILGLGPEFTAYFVGFLIIGSFWVGHHRIFRHLRRWDSALIWLNMGVLVTIAIDPFVIGVDIVSGPELAGVVLAATVWASTGALLTAIWIYATSSRRLVSPTLSQAYVDRFTEVSVITPLFFAASIGVAVLSASLATAVWIAGIVVQTAARARLGGHRRGRPAPAPPAVRREG